MPVRSRALVALTFSVAVVALLTGCAPVASTKSTGSPSAAPTKRGESTIPLRLNLAAHSVAQEGLAIALASNVLQTQLALVQYSQDSSAQGCKALAGGGSSSMPGFSQTSGSDYQLAVDTFYDSACAQKYLTQQATVSMSGDSAAVTATTTYFGKTGTTLGVLATTATASFDNSIHLAGTGTFTSTAGQKSSLGLACQGTSSDTILDCQGGIAQDFPALDHSLGSITPLVLTIGADVSDPITFTGSGRTTSNAAIGAVTVTDPGGALALAGAASQSTAAVTTGQAGGFVLFPATPTGWTVTDQADDVAFTISVTDNTTRALAATVTQLSTSKVLARLSLDQSGTGTIVWDGQKPAPITSWLLSR